MEKRVENKNKKKKLPLVIKIVIGLVLILSITCMGMIGFLNVIPIKYLIIIGVVVILFDTIIISLLRKKSKPRKIGLIISLIFIIIYTIGIIYLGKTFNFFNKINDSGTSNINYVVVVKKDSDYNDIKDLKKCSMGVLNVVDNDYDNAKKELKKQITFDE